MDFAIKVVSFDVFREVLRIVTFLERVVGSGLLLAGYKGIRLIWIDSNDIFESLVHSDRILL